MFAADAWLITYCADASPAPVCHARLSPGGYRGRIGILERQDPSATPPSPWGALVEVSTLRGKGRATRSFSLPDHFGALRGSRPAAAGGVASEDALYPVANIERARSSHKGFSDCEVPRKTGFEHCACESRISAHKRADSSSQMGRKESSDGRLGGRLGFLHHPFPSRSARRTPPPPRPRGSVLAPWRRIPFPQAPEDAIVVHRRLSPGPEQKRAGYGQRGTEVEPRGRAAAKFGRGGRVDGGGGKTSPSLDRRQRSASAVAEPMRGGTKAALIASERMIRAALPDRRLPPGPDPPE